MTHVLRLSVYGDCELNDALAAVSDAGIRPLRAAPVGTRAHVFHSRSLLVSLSHTHRPHTLSLSHTLPYSSCVCLLVCASRRGSRRMN